MKSFKRYPTSLALAACVLLASGAAYAATPAAPAASAPQVVASGKQTTYGVKLGGFFNEEHRQAARTAFAKRYAKAKDCPVGLERAAKGCAALVEGRYWAVGQRLQSAVKPNPVPDAVVAKLPAAPSGYEYVMAGQDILLMSKGLQLVVDMIENVTG